MDAGRESFLPGVPPGSAFREVLNAAKRYKRRKNNHLHHFDFISNRKTKESLSSLESWRKFSEQRPLNCQVTTGAILKFYFGSPVT